MSIKQQKFEFAQHQRAMLEFIAMIRFISTCWDRMNAPVPDRKVVDSPEDVVGAFFSDPTMADIYWKAGIPVWLVCPAYKAGALRIDRLVDTIKGRDVLVVEDDPTDHRGVYYSGSPHSSEKYKFFVEYTRRYLSGSNPFVVTETSWSFGDLGGENYGNCCVIVCVIVSRYCLAINYLGVFCGCSSTWQN